MEIGVNGKGRIDDPGCLTIFITTIPSTAWLCGGRTGRALKRIENECTER